MDRQKSQILEERQRKSETLWFRLEILVVLCDEGGAPNIVRTARPWFRAPVTKSANCPISTLIVSFQCLRKVTP